MNPGYLSLLLMTVTIILFASGWKDIIARGITSNPPSADPFYKRKTGSRIILLFFVSWVVASRLSVPVAGGKVNLCIAILCVLIGYAIWRTHGWLHRFHIVSASALLGSISFFMLETIHLVPGWISGSAELSMALLFGALVSGLTRLPSVQLAVVSIGLLLAELYRGYLHRDYVGIQLGFPAFQDRWWLTVYMTRICSLALACVSYACKKSAYWVSDKIRKTGGGDSE